MEWESRTHVATSGLAPAVALTAPADVWPRAIETDNGATLCPIRTGKDCNFNFIILSQIGALNRNS